MRPDNIVIADMGIDEETRKICMLLCEEFEFIYICDSQEVISFLMRGFIKIIRFIAQVGKMLYNISIVFIWEDICIKSRNSFI